MVKLKELYGLPFCDIEIEHNHKKLLLKNILIDTGSGGTIFKMEKVEEIDIVIDENDTIETISGVGGDEFVFVKNLEKLKVGTFEIENFKVEIGVMDYGFDIEGIIGMNFLKKIKARIDLNNMEIK
ncbi:retropepsin-like aspartic protease [uncultured Clostridium sp.]|uniref:retropepsin-like aspartic protease n=1 Tax=uncultured Clostridium sp. TaxID=59620 RepID=UPI0026173FD3|nr:retropepsin-like aspartic protease [uncultured Clostridium sp.]